MHNCILKYDENKKVKHISNKDYVSFMSYFITGLYLRFRWKYFGIQIYTNNNTIEYLGIVWTILILSYASYKRR